MPSPRTPVRRAFPRSRPSVRALLLAPLVAFGMLAYASATGARLTPEGRAPAAPAAPTGKSAPTKPATPKPAASKPAPTKPAPAKPAPKAPPKAAPTPADLEMDGLAERYIDFELESRPDWATQVGIHDYDGKVEATSAAMIKERGTKIRGFQQALAAIPLESLNLDRKLDARVLAGRMASSLLTIEEIRPWQKNPNWYNGLITGGVDGLLKRDFAPLDTRVAAVVSRMNEVPRVLADARANLENPPKIFTDVAILQFAGTVRYYRDELPARVAAVTDTALLRRFHESNARALQALSDFTNYLNGDLLAHSNGDFALGEELYAKKLAADEGVTTPIDSLLRIGEAEIVKTHAAMQDAAAKFAPGVDLRTALRQLSKDHPTGPELVPDTEKEFERIRAFLKEKDLITIPANENIHVAPTPVFQRALSFASMSSPGVLETKATEAYYYVTPPDSTWPPEKQEDHLAFYNRYAGPVVTVHEAFPGHYYQFLRLRECPSKVRKLFGCGSFTEGWAHYCEQMMVDEGFGGGDPRVRFAQLDLALQRLARYVVGIRLHTRGMTYDEAVAFFEKEGLMEPVNAEREARRGTSDPTYLVYTLGKMEILSLRSEMQKKEGKRFRLKSFHDRLLSFGMPPLPIVHEAFLASAKP